MLSSVTRTIMDKVDPLLSASHSIRTPSFIDDAYQYIEETSSFLECNACKAGIYALDTAIKTKVVTQALEEFAILICNQMMTANNTVCPGAVTEMGDIIVPVLANFLLGPDYLCSRVMKVCHDPFVELDHKDFVNRVLSDKPEWLKSNDYVHNLYKDLKEKQAQSNEPRKTFKAVHFSDAHVDLMYKEGTNAQCNMPLCCREENGYPSDPANAA